MGGMGSLLLQGPGIHSMWEEWACWLQRGCEGAWREPRTGVSQLEIIRLAELMGRASQAAAVGLWESTGVEKPYNTRNVEWEFKNGADQHLLLWRKSYKVPVSPAHSWTLANESPLHIERCFQNSIFCRFLAWVSLGKTFFKSKLFIFHSLLDVLDVSPFALQSQLFLGVHFYSVGPKVWGCLI